jgi:hypothetical protein
MLITVILEWGLVVLCAVFVITQLIIPAFNDKQLFPLFRRAEKEKEVVEELIREKEVECETELAKKELEALVKIQKTLKKRKEDKKE